MLEVDDLEFVAIERGLYFITLALAWFAGMLTLILIGGIMVEFNRTPFKDKSITELSSMRSEYDFALMEAEVAKEQVGAAKEFVEGAKTLEGALTDFAVAAEKVADFKKKKFHLAESALRQRLIDMELMDEDSDMFSDTPKDVEFIDMAQNECDHDYKWNKKCGAEVCSKCNEHRGLAKCFCGWNLQDGERLEDDIGESTWNDETESWDVNY